MLETRCRAASAEGAERSEVLGEGVFPPQPTTWSLGEHRKLPQQPPTHYRRISGSQMPFSRKNAHSVCLYGIVKP